MKIDKNNGNSISKIFMKTYKMTTNNARYIMPSHTEEMYDTHLLERKHTHIVENLEKWKYLRFEEGYQRNI